MARNARMVLLIATLLYTFTAASSTQFIVGGERGWIRPDAINGLDYTALSNTTTFVVGDSLVFKYNRSAHNVLSVTGPAFAACNVSEPLETFTDGNTIFTFEKPGRWWFICGAPGHCAAGQAFKVTVVAGADLSSSAAAPATPPESGSGNALVQSLNAVVLLGNIVVGFSLL